MAGELDAYADALNAFKTARAKVMIFANNIVEIGEYMQKHPGRIGFANLGAAHPMSAEIVKTVNAAEWPTAQQLQEAINRYHSTQSDMYSAFNKIPPERRSVVEQPPAKDRGR